MSVVKNHPIYKQTEKITKYVYSQLDKMPESEKWNTTIQLRSSAVYLLVAMASALSLDGPQKNPYEWGGAVKHTNALRALLDFANKEHLLKVDPDIMVSLDKLIAFCDAELEDARKQSELTEKKDIDAWQERYELWKKANEEMKKATT